MKDTLKRSEVLRGRRAIALTKRGARHIAGPLLHLRCSSNPEHEALPGTDLPPRRVAIILPRGVRSAVCRNLLKRRLREVWRRNRSWFPPGRDYLLFATTEAADSGFEQLALCLQTLAEKARDGR